MPTFKVISVEEKLILCQVRLFGDKWSKINDATDPLFIHYLPKIVKEWYLGNCDHQNLFDTLNYVYSLYNQFKSDSFWHPFAIEYEIKYFALQET